MKYLIFVILSAFIVSCVPTQQVQEAPSVVGYFNYSPSMQKVIDVRKANCAKTEGCEDPAPLTEQDVLGLITQIRNQMESEGATVIGIESEKSIIWFSRPIEPHVVAE